jgi:hypothetical protein
MRSRVFLPMLFSLALVACAPAQQPHTIATEDRFPNSLADMATTKCKVEPRPSFTPEDNATLCSCVVREMQRTMSMKEVLAVDEAKETAGPDIAAKNHVLMSYDKVRRIVATCINELGSPR